MSAYHQPVMLAETLEGLAIREDGVYVDVTFGGGGHSRAILQQLTSGRLVAFDQDSDALANTIEDERFLLINQNFKHLKKYLKLHNLLPINGLLADLGVSSHQFDTAARGFSIRFEGDLNMRMDSATEQTAKDLLKRATKEELQSMFSAYGEVRNAKTLAELIVSQREVQAMDTTQEFIALIEPAIKGERNKYLAQVFQAIRIAVNDELGALKDLLEQSAEVMAEGGRLVVMSYHSLEDRLVKNFIRNGTIENEPEKDLYGNFYRPFKAINKKPIEAGPEEVERNPRARSAKLRIAEKQ